MFLRSIRKQRDSRRSCAIIRLTASSPRRFRERTKSALSSGQCLTMCVREIPSMWKASAVWVGLDKGVTLISHKEKIDTNTPAGKFMLTVFAALSQLEREQLKQRQREGIEIAKAQGKYTGRKPIPTDWMRFGQLYGEWRAKNITGRDFMRRMDMSANTFYRRVREYELRHGIAEPT